MNPITGAIFFSTEPTTYEVHGIPFQNFVRDHPQTFKYRMKYFKRLVYQGYTPKKAFLASFYRQEADAFPQQHLNLHLETAARYKMKKLWPQEFGYANPNNPESFEHTDRLRAHVDQLLEETDESYYDYFMNLHKKQRWDHHRQQEITRLLEADAFPLHDKATRTEV